MLALRRNAETARGLCLFARCYALNHSARQRDIASRLRHFRVHDPSRNQNPIGAYRNVFGMALHHLYFDTAFVLRLGTPSQGRSVVINRTNLYCRGSESCSHQELLKYMTKETIQDDCGQVLFGLNGRLGFRQKGLSSTKKHEGGMWSNFANNGNERRIVTSWTEREATQTIYSVRTYSVCGK